MSRSGDPQNFEAEGDRAIGFQGDTGHPSENAVSTPRSRPQHPDVGASLILAIGFMVVIGLVGGALVGLVSSGLANRAPLQTLRSTQYAADGAIELAISQVRSISQVRATPCPVPPPHGSISDTDSPTDPPPLNSIPIRVDWVADCTGAIQGADGNFLIQRDVTFTACADTGNSSCDPPATVIIRARVNFQQQVADGPVTKTYVLSWSVTQ
jgi:hypothetical protein